MSDQPLSNRLFAIVGPTATGKTVLALRSAEALLAAGRFPGVTIIAADSRQVYQGLEICSGVDLPPDWSSGQTEGWRHFQHPTLPLTLTGVAMIAPDQEWSITAFRQFAGSVIAAAWAAGRAVILVGGSGLYQQQLFATDSQLDVPPDQELRRQWADVSRSQLQAVVAAEAADQWAQLNQSDRHNPRRLLRVLEKSRSAAAAATDPLPAAAAPLPLAAAHFQGIGLIDTPERLAPRIAARVQDRLVQGAINEVTTLYHRYPSSLWRQPAFTTTGCQEIRLYLDDQLDQAQLVERWVRRELQYAKRQLTWWKAHPQITPPKPWASHQVQWRNLAALTAAEATACSDSLLPTWQTALIESCILGQ